jgi:4-amino-4-deoxy-L-arabinose transferase-like glycosyltransferase
MESRLLKYMLIDKIKNIKFWLVAIILLAAILRLWKLGSVPPGLTPDEAALGYNAYSILKTGRDEFGVKLPIIFKSFGDYKPGLYVYLAIPSIAALGLNEFSTRLPSAVAGVISVLLIYLIIGKLKIENSKLKIIAALVAATNPYLIYFSHSAWEANVALTFTLAGIYFFLMALEKSKFLIISSLFFALTLITYQGAKLSTAIILILLVFIYWRQFWKINIKYLLISFGLGIAISIPIVMSLFNGQAFRLKIFSIFSYPRPQSEIETYSDGYFQLFHSDQLNFSRMILGRWFNFYSGKFLVFDGDLANPVNTPPYQGVLLLADLLMLPLGLFFIFKNYSLNPKPYTLIILWLILAPFSAAISRDQTNAVRCLNAAIPMVLVISLGIYSALAWISKRKYTHLLHIILLLFYIFSFIYFLDAYFIHVSAHNSNYWRYGYKEAVNYITPIQSKYENIVFEQSFDQPYIYFLFFQKYDPASYQKQANLVDSEFKGDVGFETKLDNISFEPINWSALRYSPGTLIVVGAPRVGPEILNNPKDFPIIHEIKYLNGRDVAFDFIEIK